MDVFDDNTPMSSIKDEKIKAYNILDLLKSVDKEHDLYFSYDMLKTANSDVYMKTLLDKLQISAEVTAVGNDEFLKNITNFARNVALLRDMGSNYSRKVTVQQKDFLSFSIKELSNGGKLLDKISKRILSKF
jgi:hypothetical protein